MTSPRFMLSVVLLSLSTMTFAQSDIAKAEMPMPGTPKSDMPKPNAQTSDAQKSFDQLKTLAGTWDGHVTTVPTQAEIEGKPIRATLRVTSMGHTLMHEMTGTGRPDDPITMLVVDKDRLLLTHYCDADNRPRMAGKSSPDGQTVEFDFLDVSGNLEYGHMQHAKFTLVDADHHSEEWTFMAPDGVHSVRAHMDLQRTK
jgi:hypothetical protein